MIRDNLIMALKNVWERKTRSALTLLGICIGIMAIIGLLAIGEGMQQAVTGELSSLSDTIFLTSGNLDASMAGSVELPDANDEYLTDRDLSSIARISGISDISPVLFSVGFVEENGESTYLNIIGMDPANMAEFFGIEAMGLEAGTFPGEGEQNKCVLGYNIAHRTFDQDLEIGDMIRINNYKFYIIGIYKEHGAGFSTLTDDTIHLSNRDFIKVGGNDNTNTVIVRVSDINRVDEIADEMEQAVNDNHGDDEFATATSMSSILDSIQSVLTIIQMVLLAIASIALLVASIGIMNTMFTSVMERTREIGIMKAIGAQNKDILLIFLVEGLVISFLGGIIGIVMGVAASQLLSFMISSFSGEVLSAVITIDSIVLGMGVSMLVGVISSIYPARKASLMSPIEAVRYE